jgi:hypothetical protein
MDELGAKLRAAVEPLLEPGEELRGICAATQVGLLTGRMVALAATDRRLVMQGLTRKLERKGEPRSIVPEGIVSAKADGAGGGWPELGAAIMDRAAVTLRIRTAEGERLKLDLMRGTGPLGKLGGGDSQRQGVEAVGRFFDEASGA